MTKFPLLQHEGEAEVAGPPTHTVDVHKVTEDSQSEGESQSESQSEEGGKTSLLERVAGSSYRCTLVGPGTSSGNHFRVNLSEAKALKWWEGADPAEGTTFLDQIRRGPCSLLMFISCTGFALPALIHLWKRESAVDYLAGISLLCVAVSSTLCDSFAVDSAEFDRPPYTKTACATGQPAWKIAAQVQEAGAQPVILANDHLNLLTRVLDRGTCVFVTAPCLLVYMFYQRPSLWVNLPFILGFAVAWAVCVADTRIRGEDQCGTRFVKGRWVVEQRYWLHQQLHVVWHFLLIFFMCASALYRPQL